MRTSYAYTLTSRPLPGDLHTPVSAYLRLRDASTRSILMESSDYHTGRDARSFIALEPLAEVGIAHGTGFCRLPDGSVRERAITRDYPADRLIRDFMEMFSLDRKNVYLWGFTSFNAVRYFEDIPVNDDEAVAAAYELTRLEGIIPALESAHALGALPKMQFRPEDLVVLTVSGRGDKDIETYLNSYKK